MSLNEKVLPFPTLVDNGDDTVSLTIGKITFGEATDETLLNISTENDAIKLYAKMWCIEKGYQTWADLLADPVGLIQYHAQMQVMKIAIN